MISSVLNVLEEGLGVMRSNSRMLLVGVLVFVFPLIFVWITQNFFDTAYTNINTAEKHRVGMLHDSLTAVVNQGMLGEQVVSEMINEYMKSNSDITKIRVVLEDESGFLIQHSNDESLIDTYEVSDKQYREIGFSEINNFLRFEFTIDGHRTWQVFKRIDLDIGYVYIFSEHDFYMVDSVMSARRQQSYLGLTAIFIFLITLAYWLNRQVNWEKHHRQLANQLEERDLFSNMIAHEFRTPLTTIKGYASFLQESENMSKEELRYSSNIRNSADRLVSLVNDFLEVARLQSGKIRLDKREIDVRSTLNEVVDTLQVTAKEKGLLLKYDAGKSPIIVNTDPDRLTQVVINIVTNAIKYTTDGSVELECTEARGKVSIRVMDTGAGISAEDQKKLFAPFQRVGNVESSETVGTGLGMYITKKLLSLLDGDIGVESIKGVGSHIVITLKSE